MGLHPASFSGDRTCMGNRLARGRPLGLASARSMSEPAQHLKGPWAPAAEARCLVEGSYLILYRIVGRGVEIVRGPRARDPKQI
jgi:hypothetical protein